MSTTVEENLLNLLDRPNEQIFLPKGDKGVIFNVPDEYLEERFKGEAISNRVGAGDRVQIKPVQIPNLDNPKRLGKRDFFTLFLPLHREMAGRLIEVFMDAKSLEDFMSVATYCRENMNPQMFNYAMSVAILHRKDTRRVNLPPVCEFFPYKFVDGAVFRRAREEAVLTNTFQDIGNLPLEIPLDYTASDLDVEHRVAYFREDIGINLHHWHWHLVYPFDGPRNVVDKDRRGELFYYQHQQIIARYNFERFCNKLGRVNRLSELRAPLEEGYFPKLDNLSSTRNWAARAPDTKLNDINRESEQLKFDISTLERWRDRIFDAVHTGRIIDTQGQSIALTEADGIDVLGNIIEASVLTRNRNLYGDFHNFGHVLIGLAHDPDGRFLETFSVMGDLATTMRDPAFYRWHGYIDNIFADYKRTLPSYTAQQLRFDGIRVSGIEVNSQGFPKNTFNTFWQKNDVNLTRGLDFSPRSTVFARFTHLQNAPFEYKITINNSGPRRQGTIRIFLAPINDERGLPFLYRDQRILFIELDKFVVTLNPNQNVITRRSDESSITIPFEQTFRNLNAAPVSGPGLADFNYCGCGWPQHMLLPKGNAEGYPVTLFVMVTNFEDDRVEEAQGNESRCKGAVSFCGLRDSKYPDRKPMGYPFDRHPRRGVDTLQQFMTDNMNALNLTITFTNRIAPPFNTTATQ